MSFLSRTFLLVVFTFLLAGMISAEVAAQTPQFKLMRAVERNDYEEAVDRLKDGVSANTRTRQDGIPALLIAAREGHTRMLTLLLEWRADPNIQDRVRGESALMARAGVGDVEDVRLLLDAGADPNLTDRSLETALTRAVRLRHHRVATILVEAGASIDKVDVTGLSPLDYAVRSRDRRMVKILEETKAKTAPPAQGPSGPGVSGPGARRPGPGAPRG